MGFDFDFSIPYDPPSRVGESRNHLWEVGDVADYDDGEGEPVGALIEHLG